MCRVHTYLASVPALRQAAWSEAIYAVIPIFGHILPAEHVPQNRARGKRRDMAGAAER